MAALLMACSDGRLTPILADFLAARDVTGADHLLVPGGPLVLTRPGMERRVALDCVRTLIEVHAIRTVYLITHQDCAAYARVLGGFGFDQQELLERDLRQVRRLIENTFSGVDVRCFIIPWRENGEGAGFGEAEPVD